MDKKGIVVGVILVGAVVVRTAFLIAKYRAMKQKTAEFQDTNEKVKKAMDAMAAGQHWFAQKRATERANQAEDLDIRMRAQMHDEENNPDSETNRNRDLLKAARRAAGE